MPSILITGASRGCGLELLKIYLENGWRVFPLVRDITPISNLVELYGDRCHPIIGDVAYDDIRTKIKAVLQQYTTSLDILINNV